MTPRARHHAHRIGHLLGEAQQLAQDMEPGLERLRLRNILHRMASSLYNLRQEIKERSTP